MLDSIELISSSHQVFDDATGAYSGDPDELFNKVFKERKLKATTLQSEFEESRMQVKLLIKKGYPVNEILAVEQDERVSAIVIDSHGKNNLETFFLGDVVEKVIRRSQTPVLVVKR